MSQRRNFLLDEDQVPKAWYNINADLPVPPEPVLHPGTHEPITPDFLSALLPMNLIMQHVSEERYIEIPEPVRDIYKLWRPTPMIRAINLERHLDTPAHIYFKYEGVSPVGSHKPNTAVPQAFFNKEAGTKRMTTETGAGQWGSAMSMACSFFDMEVDIFMVKISFDQKPYRRMIMEHFGGRCHSSPTELTHAGRAAREADPDGPGTLGLAVSEAVETAATSGGTIRYAAGSVLGYVLAHQTVIGIEALQQMEMAGEYPDFVIACAGGGSNFAGFAYPFVHQNLTAGKSSKVIAVEPASCPTMTRGKYMYDFGDSAGTAPIMKMHTLGHGFTPPAIHAGGLRYHGMATTVSALVENGDVEARAVGQMGTYEAATTFSRTEGIIPAPESAFAIRVAIDEALKCKESGEKKVIAFNLSGHGHFDMQAYDAYHHGQLQDDEYPEEAVAAAMADVPEIAGA